MRATWESVLKLVIVGVFVLITLQVILYAVFPDSYDPYWLSITIFVCILALIVFRLVWRVATKRFHIDLQYRIGKHEQKGSSLRKK